MIDFESQSARTLVSLAGGPSGIDAARCFLAFARPGAAEPLRCSLRSAIVRHRLSDLQFAAFVLLFEVKPMPVSIAVLARGLLALIGFQFREMLENERVCVIGLYFARLPPVRPLSFSGILTDNLGAADH